MIESYKKDQGRMARMAAFWSMAFLVLFAAFFVHDTLVALAEPLRPAIGGIEIPVLGIPVSGAVLIAAILGIGGLVLLYRWHQKPHVAELLIGTETELRKVTWPSLQEVINSSLVVIVCVLILMGFLAGVDLVLGRVFSRVLLG